MHSINNDFGALDRNLVLSWIVRTVIAMMAGAAIGFGAAQFLFCTRSSTAELLGTALLGAIIGTFTGIAQSGHIKGVIRDSRLWVIGTAAAWAISAFFFEVNWPISTCLTSSNAPNYAPSTFIRSLESPIYMFAEHLENTVVGETVYGAIYNTVIAAFMSLLAGMVLGVPQGTGQWLVLRKAMPRSSILIWLNWLLWATTFFFIIGVVNMLKSGLWVILLFPIVLILPAAGTAVALLWLGRESSSTQPA